MRSCPVHRLAVFGTVAGSMTPTAPSERNGKVQCTRIVISACRSPTLVAKSAIPLVRLDIDRLLERDKRRLVDHAPFLLHPRNGRLLPDTSHAHDHIGPKSPTVNHSTVLLDRVPRRIATGQPLGQCPPPGLEVEFVRLEGRQDIHGVALLLEADLIQLPDGIVVFGVGPDLQNEIQQRLILVASLSVFIRTAHGPIDEFDRSLFSNTAATHILLLVDGFQS
mmetsp:Transcript_31292/g.91647  ORF Transcript_31292/g.91647 Transcript_31292/m.91647 type:complete len:222 (-) Transcript_31292:711-1376(-)